MKKVFEKNNLNILTKALRKKFDPCKTFKMNFMGSTIISLGLGLTLTGLTGIGASSAYAQSKKTKNTEPVNTGPVHTLKVSFSNQQNSPKGKSVLQFKSIVEERTKGKVAVEIYPFSSLVPEENEFEALELGITDIIIPHTAKVSIQYNIPEYKFFDLPYLFTTTDDFSAILYSPKNQELLNLVNQKNPVVSALSFWGNGFKGLGANKSVIKYDDFKGLSIGMQSTDIGTKTFNNLNVLSTYVNDKDIAKNLNSRRINATEITPSAFSFLEIEKSQKFFIKTNHSYSSYTVLANNKKLKTLGNEYSSIVVNALKEMQDYHAQSAEEDNQRALLQMKDKGVVLMEVNDAFKKMLKERLSKIHEEYVKENRELMVDIYKTLLEVNQSDLEEKEDPEPVEEAETLQLNNASNNNSKAEQPISNKK